MTFATRLVGDTVFYLGTERPLVGFNTRQQIMAVNTDGSNERALTKPAKFEMLFATNTHVYVERGDGKWDRYRIDPWHKENTFKLPDDEHGFQISGGFLYYQRGADNPAKIMRRQSEGGATTTILLVDGQDELGAWVVQDGNLYYCLTNVQNATGEVWCMPLDGGEQRLVYSGAVTLTEIKEGWGYGRRITPGGASYGFPYTLSFGDMVRVDIQTGEMQDLGDRANNFFPAGDYLIYDPFDQGVPPVLLNPVSGAAQPLPEIDLGN